MTLPMAWVSLQPDIFPGLSAVERFVDSVAMRDVAADASLSGSYINDVGIGLGDGDAADVAGAFLIEDGGPAGAAID